ncbi:hypothetical protein FF011L_48820 [Roseimaritima multifibrata]|uniref:Sulfotransferase domain-containing protein n=1 Tax=Roseimaritima multifibrata TaxID=1930274 RepID=A0A517MMG2_9BACT|nr:sulfotransferase domain-containing protein [Roseimaritima multifibrata]QDS96078.1 hypothetical protein FF011L_48820 [Roseimaritima multifibrata]
MPLPNLLIIGAMKAATTSLYQLLETHEEIWFPSEKEPHYFTSKEYGQNSAFNKYKMLFDDAPIQVKYIGEASTGYSKMPALGPTASRIANDLGNPKIIYSLRDPISRIISNFRHSKLCGAYMPTLPFSKALDEDPILLQASCYARQIMEYENIFGPDAMFLITTDKIQTDISSVLAGLGAYLDIDLNEAKLQKINQKNSHEQLAKSLWIERVFSRDIAGYARRAIPQGLKSTLKSLAPVHRVEFAITPNDIERCMAILGPDLQQLLDIAGEEIRGWPCVRYLLKDPGFDAESLSQIFST